MQAALRRWAARRLPGPRQLRHPGAAAAACSEGAAYERACLGRSCSLHARRLSRSGCRKLGTLKPETRNPSKISVAHGSRGGSHETSHHQRQAALRDGGHGTRWRQSDGAGRVAAAARSPHALQSTTAWGFVCMGGTATGVRFSTAPEELRASATGAAGGSHARVRLTL